MKTNPRKFLNILAFAGIVFALGSCSYETSSSTGWNYNDPKNGGFEKVPYYEQETGPGLVLIEGGTFTMGATEEMVMENWNMTKMFKTSTAGCSPFTNHYHLMED